MSAREVHEALYVGLRGYAGLEDGTQGCRLLCGGGAQGVEERQGHFALAQVIAGGLADSGGGGEVVEDVVLYLEAEAQQLGEAEHGGGVGWHFARRVCAQQHAVGEQGGRLLADHLHVLLLEETVRAGIADLVDLAGAEFDTELAQAADHGYGTGAQAHLEGLGDEEVAYQDGDVVAPGGVDGVAASALAGVVDHVVVDQGGVVEHLQGGGGQQHVLVDAAVHLRRQQHHDGPDLLALAAQIVRHHAVHELVAGAHGFRNQPVHGPQGLLKPALYDIEFCLCLHFRVQN